MKTYKAIVNYKNKSGAVETITCTVNANSPMEAEKKMKSMYPTYTHIGVVNLVSG